MAGPPSHPTDSNAEVAPFGSAGAARCKGKLAAVERTAAVIALGVEKDRAIGGGS